MMDSKTQTFKQRCWKNSKWEPLLVLSTGSKAQVSHLSFWFTTTMLTVPSCCKLEGADLFCCTIKAKKVCKKPKAESAEYSKPALEPGECTDRVCCVRKSLRFYRVTAARWGRCRGTFVPFWKCGYSDPQRCRVGEFQLKQVVFRSLDILESLKQKDPCTRNLQKTRVLHLCLPRDTSRLIDFSFTPARTSGELCLGRSVFRVLARL